MIKVKWLGKEAYINDAGNWVSEDSKFEESLNIKAGRDQLEGYNPDLKGAMLDLAKKEYHGLEVLENKPDSKGTAKPVKDRIY